LNELRKLAINLCISASSSGLIDFFELISVMIELPS